MFVERLEKDVDADRDRTGTPIVSGQPTGLFTQLNEVDIDFRILGLPHSVAKQAENSRVRELVKKIENHPHRQDLQDDLQQHNAYNPFGEKSKKIFKDMGNVDETIPEVQCSECLFYWNKGIVYCTCGHVLRENQSSRGIFRWTLDLLTIPNYVIMKKRPHGNRHGMTEEQIKHHIAHNLRRRCKKERGFHDRFLKDPVFVTRNSAVIELKKCASRWTRNAQKKSPIVCRKTSTLDTKRIGGSLSTRLDAMKRLNSVQTSAKWQSAATDGGCEQHTSHVTFCR